MKDFDTDHDTRYLRSLLRDIGFRPYFDFGFKRILDILGSLILLVSTAPVIAAFWLLIRRDGGTGFYGQQRVGRGGRIFTCWKLRSMCIDAEARLADLIARDPTAAAQWLTEQKLQDDPRITPLGRTIRRYFIDELPQLFNVLRGEMSFVGPRPFIPSQEGLYQGDVVGYYAMRPGMTGLWQVSSREDNEFISRVDHDARYAREVSLRTDLNILLSTVRVVVDGKGK
jgi:lipopolysaccharide/colanic/teichoic acid biosynthesis glycosyltransferase